MNRLIMQENTEYVKRIFDNAGVSNAYRGQIPNPGLILVGHSGDSALFL